MPLSLHLTPLMRMLGKYTSHVTCGRPGHTRRCRCLDCGHRDSRRRKRKEQREFKRSIAHLLA